MRTETAKKSATKPQNDVYVSVGLSQNATLLTTYIAILRGGQVRSPYLRPASVDFVVRLNGEMFGGGAVDGILQDTRHQAIDDEYIKTGAQLCAHTKH